MDQRGVSRRRFIRTSAAITGAAMLSNWGGLKSLAAPSVKRTAVDLVPLGKTGITLSRLGIGTGSSSGREQTAAGRDAFNKLIRHAFDQGITYIDTAQQYATFEWIGDAIKGLPREKIFLLSKVPGQPGDILAAIDRHRSVFKTDYIDSLLIHCMVRSEWTDEWKRIMEGFNQAKEKQWIRAKGVSCHSYPALRAATVSDWTEVHLVRVNPQGKFMDGPRSEWGAQFTNPVDPILEQIKTQHDKGRGVIGMKIFGNGTFTDLADREKSVRFAMANPNIDAVTIGMKTTKEVDENLALLNRVLAET